jgi:hypothetical protein
VQHLHRSKRDLNTQKSADEKKYDGSGKKTDADPTKRL